MNVPIIVPIFFHIRLVNAVSNDKNEIHNLEEIFINRMERDYYF